MVCSNWGSFGRANTRNQEFAETRRKRPFLGQGEAYIVSFLAECVYFATPNLCECAREALRLARPGGIRGRWDGSGPGFWIKEMRAFTPTRFG